MRLLRLAALTAMFAATACLALPPAMEADRKILAAEAAGAANDWPAAVSAYEEARKLDAKRMPATYAYLYGHALYKAGSFDAAQTQIEAYLSKATPSTKFYREALADLNGIETGRKQAAEREERERNLAAIKEEIERRTASSWVTLATIRREYPARGTDSCDEVKQYTRNRAKSMRNFTCSCSIQRVDHPAYRDRREDYCRATWQANLFLDKEGSAASYSGRKSSGDSDGWIEWDITSRL